MILLDVYSLNAYKNRKENSVYEWNQMQNFWSSDNYFSFQNTFKYDKEKVILDKYTLIEKKRVRVIYNWLQYFSTESFQSEFEENGFAIMELFSYVSGNKYQQNHFEFAASFKKE